MIDLAVVVFIVALVPIPILVYIAWKRKDASGALYGKDLGAFAVGISAAATGNSGFIMTGAVGLGFAFGLQWILLPISWLLGDLVFWKFGPHRINEYARRSDDYTISDIIAGSNGDKVSKFTALLCSVIAAIFLGAYVASQWVAGATIISPLFDIDGDVLILVIGIFVIAYCTVGRFRGSVYTDMYQASIMFVITIVSLAMVLTENGVQIDRPPGFNSIIGVMSIPVTIAFVVGFAFASIGFGFGQPQIITRYIAGKSSGQIRSAKWIYIGFLQFTWIGMTLFGYILAGTGIEVENREAALVTYFDAGDNLILLGIASAGVFAAIASTVDSIILAVGDMVRRAMLEISSKLSIPSGWLVVIFGSLTVVAALQSDSTVFDIALFAVSMTGGAFAGPVIIRVFDLRGDNISVLAALLTGLVSSFVWRLLGYEVILNEAFIGIASSVIANYLVYFLSGLVGPRSG